MSPARLIMRWVPAMCLLAWGCASEDQGAATNSGVDRDASTVGDTSTAPSADTSAQDSGTFTPDAGADTRGDPETTAQTAPTKSDEDYLVPAGVAERSAVAVQGTMVAWVERATAPSRPVLRVWDVQALDVAPRSFRPPHLSNPSQLALAPNLLYYVDDRYGDADIFAIDLSVGSEQVVVAVQGPQTHPSARRDQVVWQDCRRCVSGHDGSGWEIVRWSLAGGEIPVTTNNVSDQRPAFGDLADGAEALAWVGEGRLLRARGPEGDDIAIDAAVPVHSVALTRGVLVWRPEPVIINPDSMYPSDVMLTLVAGGATSAATFHAEAVAGLNLQPVAADGRIAWLQGVISDPSAGQLVVAPPTGSDPILRATRPGLSDLALSTRLAAFLAPRDDNGGRLDVHLVTLP